MLLVLLGLPFILFGCLNLYGTLRLPGFIGAAALFGGLLCEVIGILAWRHMFLPITLVLLVTTLSTIVSAFLATFASIASARVGQTKTLNPFWGLFFWLFANWILPNRWAGFHRERFEFKIRRDA